MANQKTDYEFDGRGGKCNICLPVIHFTSAVNAKDHILGSKHQKSIRMYQDNIRVLGPEHMQMFLQNLHTSSVVINHHTNDACLADIVNKTLDWKSSLFDRRKQKANKEVFDTMGLLPTVLGFPKDDDLNKTSTTIKSFCDVTASTVGVEYDDRECFVCNVMFTSDITKQQHLDGGKHLKQLRRLMESTAAGPLNASKTLWYRCNICDTSVNSEEQIEKHKIGKRHIIRAAQAAQQGNRLGLSNLNDIVKAPGHGRPQEHTPSSRQPYDSDTISFENSSNRYGHQFLSALALRQNSIEFPNTFGPKNTRSNTPAGSLKLRPNDIQSLLPDSILTPLSNDDS